MKDKKKAVLYWCAVIAVAALVLLVVALTMVGVPRSSKAQKYDLECLITLSKDPLIKCKEK